MYIYTHTQNSSVPSLVWWGRMGGYAEAFYIIYIYIHIHTYTEFQRAKLKLEEAITSQVLLMCC